MLRINTVSGNIFTHILRAIITIVLISLILYFVGIAMAIIAVTALSAFIWQKTTKKFKSWKNHSAKIRTEENIEIFYEELDPGIKSAGSEKFY